jgi:hypothetical protein
MPDRIDAAVQRLQHAGHDATVDRIFAHVGADQLPASDDSVLARRQAGDRLVGRSRRTFAAPETGNVRLDRHAPMVAPTASRITTELQRLCTKTQAQAPSRHRCRSPANASARKSA